MPDLELDPRKWPAAYLLLNPVVSHSAGEAPEEYRERYGKQPSRQGFYLASYARAELAALRREWQAEALAPVKRLVERLAFNSDAFSADDVAEELDGILSAALRSGAGEGEE